jgi:uncharacterized protein
MSGNLLPRKKEIVLALEPSAEVLLFGSRARNEEGLFSDWDFLVLVDGVVDSSRADRLRHALYEIEWETGEVISTFVKSRQLWYDPAYRIVPLYQSVTRDGIRI